MTNRPKQSNKQNIIQNISVPSGFPYTPPVKRMEHI